MATIIKHWRVFYTKKLAILMVLKMISKNLVICKTNIILQTRMHSSRMRTVRSSGHILEGGRCLPGGGLLRGGVSAPGVGVGRVCSGGCLLLGGVCSWGCLLLEGCLLPGRGGIPACTEADAPTPSPRGQADACKNITFTTSLRTVITRNLFKSKTYGVRCVICTLYLHLGCDPTSNNTLRAILLCSLHFFMARATRRPPTKRKFVSWKQKLETFKDLFFRSFPPVTKTHLSDKNVCTLR